MDLIRVSVQPSAFNQTLRFSLFSALIAIALGGCLTSTVRNLPAGLSGERVEDILVLEEQNRARLQDFDGEARVSLEVEGVRYRASAFVRFKSPDLLKMEVTDPVFGRHVMTALIREDSLEIYIPEVKTIYAGKVDGPLFWEITRVDLGRYDPKYALLGLIDIGQDDLQNMVGFRATNGRRVVTFEEDKWTKRLWIDRKTLLVVEEEIFDRSANLVARRTMGDYRNMDGVVLPKSVKIEQGKSHIKIRFVESAVNTGLSEDMFQMKFPKGTLRVRVLGG